ncbi:MAG: hypothetical protein ACM3Y9_05755 [Ignavibacteria bacterium]
MPDGDPDVPLVDSHPRVVIVMPEGQVPVLPLLPVPLIEPLVEPGGPSIVPELLPVLPPEPLPMPVPDPE